MRFRLTCSGVGSKLFNSDKNVRLHNSLSKAKMFSHSCSGSRRFVLFIRISGCRALIRRLKRDPCHPRYCSPTCFLTEGSSTLLSSSFLRFAMRDYDISIHITVSDISNKRAHRRRRMQPLLL